MNYTQKRIKAKNVYMEVKARYLKKEDGMQKQWFAQNVSIMINNCKIKYDELILNFNHIDANNPEFFLQAGQVIRVIEGEIKEENGCICKQIAFDIESFRQTDDEERKKINLQQ